MKWLATLFAVGLCVSLSLAQESPQKVAVALYVAPIGSDDAPGTLERPFVTVERARAALRELRAAGQLTGPATVYLRGGTYPLPQTLKLDAADSGTAATPIVYRAYQTEKPILLGGKVITGFVPWRGKILKADLRQQGFPKAGFRQLIFSGVRQPMARYPNFDPHNPYGGGYAYVDGKPKAMYTDYPDDNKRLLQYMAKDARQWAHPEDGQVFIFARYNWWNNIVPIKSVDPATRTITLANDASYVIRPTDRYFVQGMLEELDAPGEWYLDPRTEALYFWPPQPLTNQTVCAPTMRTMIQMGPNCNFVTFRGLTLECCDGDAITLNDCSDCLIAGSTIRNVGDYNGSAVVITGGRRNGVAGNDIYQIGHDGVRIAGGDRITLTPGDSYADNNYIHHVGIFYKWGTGIDLDGCGLRATHNLIHDCPRAAIQFMGNNLVMDYNHMRHLCLDSEDAAGIGTGGRDWISSRGSSVSYNYIHDVLGYGRMNGRWVSPFFAWGIYLDDNSGGVDVIGNIVARCGRAGLHLHNARDTVVENNVFVDNTQYQIELSGWTVNHPFWKYHLPTMIKGYDSVIAQPAWQKMRGMGLRPEDAPLPDGTIMAGNVFERNIVATHDPAAVLYRVSNVNFSANRWDANNLWHYGSPVLIDGLGSIPPAAQFVEWQKHGEDEHAVVADPLFVNPAKDDYRLQPGAPALRRGFKPLPIAQIGPYKSDLRATWPINEAEGAREHPLVAESPTAAALAPSATVRYPLPLDVPRLAAAPATDALFATLVKSGLALKLGETPDRLPVKGTPATAWAAHDGTNLYFALRVPAAAAGLNRGEVWGSSDGAELCFADASARKLGPIFVLHSFLTGKMESATDAGAPAGLAAKVGQATRYTARVTADGWEAAWVVPLAAVGVNPQARQRLAFNLGVRRMENDEWLCWAGAMAANWHVECTGSLILQ